MVVCWYDTHSHCQRFLTSFFKKFIKFKTLKNCSKFSKKTLSVNYVIFCIWIADLTPIFSFSLKLKQRHAILMLTKPNSGLTGSERNGCVEHAPFDSVKLHLLHSAMYLKTRMKRLLKIFSLLCMQSSHFKLLFKKSYRALIFHNFS